MRASQDIPPATRRRVKRRDRDACVVSGCRNSSFVDVHHLRWREDGGEHDEDNLVVMCSAHHRAVHRGRLRIEGAPSTGMTFFHADGAPCGSPRVTADRAEVGEQLFSALRHMGFRASEAKRAATHVGDGAELEGAVREGLGVVTG